MTSHLMCYVGSNVSEAALFLLGNPPIPYCCREGPGAPAVSSYSLPCQLLQNCQKATAEKVLRYSNSERAIAVGRRADLSPSTAN